MSRSCLASPCGSTGNVGCPGGLLMSAVFDFTLSLRYSASLWRYSASPYRCGIRLRCGGIRLRLFNRFLQVVVAAPGHGCRERGLWREIIDCVEKNLQTSYRALPLNFSFPLWNHSLPARLTQFLLIMTPSLRPRETHDRTRPPRGQHSIRGNRRTDTQAVRNRERTRKHNQRETTYVTMTGERTRKQHNGDNRRKDA